tara:strand:+ start:66 stop:911 length:846 start_codon:yes stop_codon:yes gene_type:complete
MFSIIIPTYNNLEYLKICIESLKRNSTKDYEIIIHVNEGVDGTLEYVNNKKIKHTYSQKNIGLCSSLNVAAKKVSQNNILYAHDDMYFCPNWDSYLIEELNKINDNKFYLSGTMVGPQGHIKFNCGATSKEFDEKRFLNNYRELNFYDHQGSHFCPHLVAKSMWDKVGGFSEEYNPGDCSDPDFNMKLWNEDVRIFKGINNFKVYHFGSATIRKKKEFKYSKGDKIFLKKWGISHKFFKKYYLRSRSKFEGPLTEPYKNFNFYIEYLVCKIKLLYVLMIGK